MRVERDYQVPPAKLFAVLTDEVFLAARSARFGGSAPPTVRRNADTVVVTIPRQLPVESVPAAFRGFVGSGAVVQTETWFPAGDGSARGDWTSDAGNSPLELSGSQEVTATAGGCRYVVTAQVKVRIPFVGGRAEAMVRSQLEDLVGKEQDFAAEWLARPSTAEAGGVAGR